MTLDDVKFCGEIIRLRADLQIATWVQTLAANLEPKCRPKACNTARAARGWSRTSDLATCACSARRVNGGSNGSSANISLYHRSVPDIHRTIVPNASAPRLKPLGNRRIQPDLQSETPLPETCGRRRGSPSKALAERSAARLAHQSGGLGVPSSNLGAPTNQINDLSRSSKVSFPRKSLLGSPWETGTMAPKDENKREVLRLWSQCAAENTVQKASNLDGLAFYHWLNDQHPLCAELRVQGRR
jgi:hypothetical protein